MPDTINAARELAASVVGCGDWCHATTGYTESIPPFPHPGHSVKITISHPSAGPITVTAAAVEVGADGSADGLRRFAWIDYTDTAIAFLGPPVRSELRMVEDAIIYALELHEQDHWQ